MWSLAVDTETSVVVHGQEKAGAARCIDHMLVAQAVFTLALGFVFKRQAAKGKFGFVAEGEDIHRISLAGSSPSGWMCATGNPCTNGTAKK